MEPRHPHRAWISALSPKARSCPPRGAALIATVAIAAFARGGPWSRRWKWRARYPADRQQRNARNHRNPASMSAPRMRKARASPVGAWRSARVQSAVGQDQQAPDQRSTEPARSDARRPGRLDYRRARTIGPTRYIADLGILFDRSARRGPARRGGRAAPFANRCCWCRSWSTRGTLTSVELRNPWQRPGRNSHRAERDRLCPGERAGGRSVAGQRRPVPAPGARMVAQRYRPLWRGQRAGRRSSPSPPVPGWTGARLIHRALRA